MSSYGKNETDQLRENLQNQLERLVEQLDDLEKCRDDLDVEEYEETKQDTMEQLKELNNSLDKLISGNMSLSSALESMQLATRAAISEAFKTPDVIKLFGRKQPKQLREKLLEIEQTYKLNKLSADARDRQKAEILTALRQLGEQLSATDLQFLEKHNRISDTNVEFVEIQDT